MRTTIRVLALALTLLTLAGCRARVDIAMSIRPDGSGEVVLATGIDSEARRLLAARAPELDTPPTPEGFREEPWSDDGFEGRRFIVPFESLRELEGFFNVPGAPPVVETDRRGDELALTIDLDALVDGMAGDVLARAATASGGGSLTPHDLARHLDVRLVVRLPGRVIEHNADERKSDGELVWKLLPVTVERAEVTADLRPRARTMPGPTALGTALVIAWVAILRRRRRRRFVS